MNELEAKTRKLAQAPVLLVATDYDGTLAPIVEDPSAARPHREAIVALRTLAFLPHTQVVIISGRSLSDLAELSGAPEGVHLVGSHGSEFDPGFADRLSTEERDLHARLIRELGSIAERGPGLAIETKPASIAFHYRNAADGLAASAVQAVLEGPALAPGVEMRTGKKVIELSVVATNKGRALEQMRARFGATAACFLGDDVTDEDAFRTLSGPDVSIKVGQGETLAEFRIDGPQDVARFFARLAEERQSWFLGAQTDPIEDHSMLSDLRTVAMVSPRGSVGWFCAPRIDSSAIFAELLGGMPAGTFAVQPTDGSRPIAQEYMAGSLVLQTRWRDVQVTDYLDCTQGRPQQRAGRSDLLRVIEGRGEVEITFAPRLDFGRVQTEIIEHRDGLEVSTGVDGIVLRSPNLRWDIELEGDHHTARARVNLTEEPVILELRFGTADLGESVLPEGLRRERTVAFWREWSEKLHLPATASEDVRIGALVLKGLVYVPTGAISAAATTSLPEHMGGVRNWDYRFCWLRDGAMSAEALVRLGSVREAMSFLDWVLSVLDHLPDPERLRPLYTVTGSELGSEAEIAELSGYGGSRPVRVGNGASQQVQLDVFGPVVQLIYVLCMEGAPLSQEHSGLVKKLVRAVAARWHEPDHGIWEIRDRPRHHVHSKVMCWMCVDRAVSIFERFRGEAPMEWLELRSQIAADILENGWHEELQAYPTAYGHAEMDAASLWVGLSGLVPPDDERFILTIEKVRETLVDEATVYRYRHDDGLPGSEAGFHICTSWLIDSLILVGRLDEARELFEILRGLSGKTNLLSEQYDPATRLGLGNHPQAYSHLGLIHNALNLEAKSRGSQGSATP